jgi:hypothetical protein
MRDPDSPGDGTWRHASIKRMVGWNPTNLFLVQILYVCYKEGARQTGPHEFVFINNKNGILLRGCRSFLFLVQTLFVCPKRRKNQTGPHILNYLEINIKL